MNGALARTPRVGHKQIPATRAVNILPGNPPPPLSMAGIEHGCPDKGSLCLGYVSVMLPHKMNIVRASPGL